MFIHHVGGDLQFQHLGNLVKTISIAIIVLSDPCAYMESDHWVGNSVCLYEPFIVKTRALRVLDTRLVLEIFCPTRTRLGLNTTRTE